MSSSLQMSERPMKPCPICGKSASPLTRPFCSRRCKDVDLGHWLTELYVIPAVPADDPAADAEIDAEGSNSPLDKR